MVYSIAGICVVGHLAAWSYAGWVLVSDIYQAVTAGTISPTLLLTLILILMGISFFAIGMGLVYLVQMIYQSFCLNKTR